MTSVFNGAIDPRPKDAHEVTVHRQQVVASSLNFSDTQDFDDARQGFIDTIEHAEIKDSEGRVVWSMREHAFLGEGRAPLTVNPSLWRMARLNAVHGLFRVCERIYQVRGFDNANITFIEGDSGLIVIDPMTFEEQARAALALYEKHFGSRRIIAVFYSHSHRDHYGGVKGVVSEEEVAAGRVEIIAPQGFMEEVMSEAVLAGVPSRRRAEFQFGTYLEAGERSHVDSGNGKTIGKGTSGLIPPTRSICQTGERLVVDGVEIVFQMTQNAEAPAEMNFYFPGLRALNMAENACHTMHQLCPIRGAKVRDALAWARYLDESVDLYAGSVDVCFAQHQWPTWGTDNVVQYLSEQRDLYRYLHDQTLRLMSRGLTATEISEQLMIPNELSRKWHTRGYYGAVVHNVQAIYTFYMGPFDGNPANLDPLEPVEAARKYLEYMGGAEAALAQAQGDFRRGEFRWVAKITNQLVFADPSNTAARALCADALEQLGYISEAATWRNAYLLGARELREGVRKRPPDGNAIPPSVVAQLSMPQLFDFLAIRVPGDQAPSQEFRFDWVMDDEENTHKLTRSNGSLKHRPGSHGVKAHAVLHATRAGLQTALRPTVGLHGALDRGLLSAEGDVAALRALFASLEVFDYQFNVVEP